eukprot:gnl/MRDRNA2_/MRDRNA2_114032_c0_seq1.p1 gnl/MRDRNA2_/MRDRNA2_114032_c0~~gnl/MRDRNA2_/MRDRNA2_114032_c0_seq1.p1  ORF type:complete len:302 (-),score=38.91 gnl/MRDRNA2_/MRDRNA2_114032_c0_seq1:124-1029(-)
MGKERGSMVSRSRSIANGVLSFGLVASGLPALFTLLLIGRCLPENYFRASQKKGITLWCRLFLYAVGTNLRAEGLSSVPEESLILFLHASSLDPFMIGAVWPHLMFCVGKRELFKLPVFGWLAYLLGMVPIDRSNLKDAIATLDKAARKAQDGRGSVALAPEGTRRRSPSIGPDQILPFKKGPFHLAVKERNKPLSLVSMWGGHSSWPPERLVPAPGSTVVLKASRFNLKPEETVEELMARVRKAFEEDLEGGVPPASADSEVLTKERLRVDALMCIIPSVGMTAISCMILRSWLASRRRR